MAAMKRTILLAALILPLVATGLALATPASANADPTDAYWLGGWRATMLDGRAVTTPRAPVMRFDAAGAVSGWTGCNRFGASWSGTATALRVTTGMTTRMACVGPDNRIEADFLRVLSGARRLERNGDVLVVWSDAGRSEFIRDQR